MIREFDFTYCPQCTATFDKKKDHLLCPRCKLQYYVNPRPTNAVLLMNNDQELMLVKRGKKPKKGLWDLPGGFIDINETVENSLHREVHEELGVQITDLRYITSFYDTYEFGGIQAYTLCVLFEAHIINPQNLKASDDVESYHYFKTDELPYDQFAFAPMRDALLRLYSRKAP